MSGSKTVNIIFSSPRFAGFNVQALLADLCDAFYFAAFLGGFQGVVDGVYFGLGVGGGGGFERGIALGGFGARVAF